MLLALPFFWILGTSGLRHHSTANKPDEHQALQQPSACSSPPPFHSTPHPRPRNLPHSPLGAILLHPPSRTRHRRRLPRSHHRSRRPRARLRRRTDSSTGLSHHLWFHGRGAFQRGPGRDTVQRGAGYPDGHFVEDGERGVSRLLGEGPADRRGARRSSGGGFGESGREAGFLMSDAPVPVPLWVVVFPSSMGPLQMRQDSAVGNEKAEGDEGQLISDGVNACNVFHWRYRP